MNVTDTKLIDKQKECSKCGIIKNESLFIPKRNICKECRNKNNREKYNSLLIINEIEQECNICNNNKL